MVLHSSTTAVRCSILPRNRYSGKVYHYTRSIYLKIRRLPWLLCFKYLSSGDLLDAVTGAIREIRYQNRRYCKVWEIANNLLTLHTEIVNLANMFLCTCILWRKSIKIISSPLHWQIAKVISIDHHISINWQIKSI